MNPFHFLSILFLTTTSLAAVLPIRIIFPAPYSTGFPVVHIIRRITILRFVLVRPFASISHFHPCHHYQHSQIMSAPSEDKHAEAGHGPQPVVQSKQDDQTDESSAEDALIASSSVTSHPSIEHPHGHSHGPSPAEHHGEVDTHQYFEYDGNNHNQGEQPKKDLRKRDFGASSLEAGHGPVIHPTGPRLEKRDFGASSLEAGHGPVIHPTGQRLEKRSVQEPMIGAMQVSSRTGGALHVGEGEKVEKGN